MTWELLRSACWSQGSWLGAIWLLQAACLGIDPPRADIVPPTVVDFAPQGQDVPVDTEVAVVFSEPVDPRVITDGLVVLASADLVDEAFLKDFDSPPLSAQRAKELVAVQADLDLGGSRVKLLPSAALRFGRGYAVLVSSATCDLAGNPLVDELRFDERGRAVGAQTHKTLSFATRAEPSLPVEVVSDVGRVAFSEILANPEGPEAQGEYVEVVNLDEVPVDLAGWRLDDSGGESSGDELRSCVEGEIMVIAPGAAALLVGRGFIAPADLKMGTPLFCGEHSSLTPRGLRNSGGEVLVLKDTLEREVARYGGWVDFSTREGCSASRLDQNTPDGPDSWVLADAEPCRSPGWLPGR